MALVLNTSETVQPQCTSLLFTDITGQYNDPANLTGFGTPNPNYTDIATVQWELFDGSMVSLGTYTNSGWIPSLGDESIYLFPSEFGLASPFTNGDYTIRYTVTMNDNSVYTHDSDFTVDCEDNGEYCTTANNIFRFHETGITFPCTLTNFVAYNITVTNPTPTPLANMAALVVELNTLAAAQTNVYVKWCLFSENSSTITMSTPYYDGTIGHQSITINNGSPITNVAYQRNGIELQTQMIFDMAWDCDTSKLTVTNVGYNWDGSVFPSFADIDGNVTFQLLDASLAVLGSIDYTNAEFQAFIASGVQLTAADFQIASFTPCVQYYINPLITLLNGSNLNCLNAGFSISACGALRSSGLVVKTSTSFNCNCSQFIICDSTGTHDSVSNPTGYGEATVPYADIYRTTFDITLSDGTVVSLNKNFIPSELGENCVAITLADLYGDDTQLTTIPDYLYPITYKVFSECDELLGSSTFRLRFVCNLTNCIDARMAAMGCGCDENEKAEIMDLKFNLDMIKNPAIPSNQLDCIANKLTALSKSCLAKCATCQ